MSETNPEIEAQMDQLAMICCQRLKGDPSAEGRTESLMKSILMSGYSLKSGRSFQTDLERRIKDQCREVAMHRGGALSSMTSKLDEKFREMARWETKSPQSKSKAKSANISSSTDA